MGWRVRFGLFLYGLKFTFRAVYKARFGERVYLTGWPNLSSLNLIA
ncbi:MAG: hypothetical protein HXK63_07025 [Campylobacter sp.]|nr:hypothetical protein [Campylobacter sp.]